MYAYIYLIFSCLRFVGFSMYKAEKNYENKVSIKKIQTKKKKLMIMHHTRISFTSILNL